MTVELLGVPFDGWGRPGAQSRAAEALGEAGLGCAFNGEVMAGPDP